MKRGLIKQLLCLLLVCVMVVQPVMEMKAKAFTLTAAASLFGSLFLGMGIKMLTDRDLIQGIRNVTMKMADNVKALFHQIVQKQVESGSDVAYISPEAYSGFRAAVMEYVPTAETTSIPRGVEVVPFGVPLIRQGIINGSFLRVPSGVSTWENGRSIPFVHIADWYHFEAHHNVDGVEYIQYPYTGLFGVVDPYTFYKEPRLVGIGTRYSTRVQSGQTVFFGSTIDLFVGYQITAESEYVVKFFNSFGSKTVNFDAAESITTVLTPPYEQWKYYNIPATIPITTIPAYHPATEGTLAPPIPLEGGHVAIRVPADIMALVDTGAASLSPSDIIVEVTNPPISPPINPPINPPAPPFSGNGFEIDVSLIKRKFPFSIPWDIYKVYQSFVAPPEAPRWEIPFSIASIGYKDTIVIDLKSFNGIAEVSRYLFSVIFLIGLILATKRIIG